MTTSPTHSSAPPRPALHQPAYWGRVAREASQYHWSKTTMRGATMCLPIIATWFILGVMRNHEERAIFAVAGAVTASFGAFQRLGDSRLKPTVVLLVGMAFFTFLGSVSLNISMFAWAALATAAGFGFGAMTALGYGGWWIGLQWMVCLLAFGSHAADPHHAMFNALFVVLGGASQVLFLAATGRFSAGWFSSQDQPPWDPVDSLGETFIRNTNPASKAGGYAVRVAAAMAMSSLIWHLWKLPNGYWTPMTAAILLKPDFHEVTLRGAGRLIGTLIGAGLVTMLVAVIKPGPVLLGCLLLSSIWACLALLRVNYALFAVCITAYVVLLLSSMGLPEPEVALHRVQATLAGALVALIVSMIPISGTNHPQTAPDKGQI